MHTRRVQFNVLFFNPWLTSCALFRVLGLARARPVRGGSLSGLQVEKIRHGSIASCCVVSRVELLVQSWAEGQTSVVIVDVKPASRNHEWCLSSDAFAPSGRAEAH